MQAGVEEGGTPQLSGTTHSHQEGPPHQKTPLVTPESSPLQGGKEREGAVLSGSYREGAAQAVTPLPPLELSRQVEPFPGPGCPPTSSSSCIWPEGLLGTLFRTLSWELFVPGGDWTPCPTFLPEVFPASTPRPQLILCSSTWQFLQVVLGHLSGTGFGAAKKPSRSPLPLRSPLSSAPFAARLQLSPPSSLALCWDPPASP